MRIPTVTVAALALMLCAAAPADAATRKAKPSCAKKGSKTVVRSRDARVYTARGVRAEGSTGTGLVGCLAANGKKTVLALKDTGESDVPGAFANVRLSGRYVAFSTRTTDTSCKASCPPEFNPDTYSVRAYDLRRGRRVRLVNTGPVSAVAVTQRGGVAWVQGSELRAVDGGGQRVLDTGAISALSAEISIVSWVRDGVERFARLR